MNIAELQRALRQLRLGGMAAVLETRLHQAQAEPMAPIDLISCLISDELTLRSDRLLDPRTGQLLREHLRQARGRRRIEDADRPKRTPLGTVQLLERAARSGPHIGQLTKVLYELQAEAAVRRILGILSFGKKYGVARVDDACAAALELQVYDYGFVRRYLERNSQPPISLRQVDPLIRQLELYRDLIEVRSTRQDNQEPTQ